MAEMRIEDRRRRVWPWVIGLLLLVLLMAALAFRSGREDGVKVRNDATRIGAAHAPAAPAPTAERGAERHKAPGTEAEVRERVLQMRTRMIA